MLVKHPGTYIQATMNNYYYFFYPGPKRFTRYSYEYSAGIMDHVNEIIEPLGQAFSYPECTAKLRRVEDDLMYRGKTLPGFSMLLTPAVYSWLLMLALFYGLRRKNTWAISLLFIPLAMMLMYILGPCNGTYGRYVYPVVVSAPVLIPMFLALIKKGTADGYFHAA